MPTDRENEALKFFETNDQQIRWGTQVGVILNHGEILAAALRECQARAEAAEEKVARMEKAIIEHNNCGYHHKCDECAAIYKRTCWVLAALKGERDEPLR